MEKEHPLAMFSSRYLPDVLVVSAICLIQMAAVIAFLWPPERRRNYTLWLKVLAAWVASMAVVSLGFMFRFRRVQHFFPHAWSNWIQGLAILWSMVSVLMIAAWAVSTLLITRRIEHSPSRRAFLQAANAAVLAVPIAVTGYGTFIQRYNLRVREQKIEIPGLAPDLNGLTIAQLTDIHLSPFLSGRELKRAVDMANETRPHVTLVTGDLISSYGDPLDECLDLLSELRSDAGTFGCMGNHELIAASENYTKERGARLGMRFLRHEAALLKFGSATLNLAGVDYQRMSARRYLPGAERLVAPGAFNVLLSHNPNVFPVAVRKGFPLTIAGHTHGGQVRVELLGEDLNVARFFTPYVDGMYRIGDAAIFVSRGIGTIGLPTRLGAPPEVALLKLCRT